ncbi:MAG: RlmE family RNA methyltransferase [Alphaproteobacteria bacterium]|jgi:23S rRNA (uridine2552-2'-O)-methyltransferase|nr:RlmE family RNA methyltransferase [Alphaproteobacteria bacterium]
MKKSYALNQNTKEKLRPNKKRSLSSQTWLKRQLNDIYVKSAKAEGYASRAAYKLIEINDKYKILKPNSRVIDLGAAPGGWSQVAAKCRPSKLIAVDLLDITPIAGVNAIKGDFTEPQIIQEIRNLLGEEAADVVMSDMAPNTTGSKSLDHLRIMNLVELTFNFATEVLAEGGVMVAKVFQGGTEAKLLAEIKQRFKQVEHFKPPASRKESAEIYLIAKGFKKS